MVFPGGEWDSSEAKSSASSFPVMPVWLGIQYSVAIVPLDLRQSSRFLISPTHLIWGGGGTMGRNYCFDSGFDSMAGVGKDMDASKGS